jgi:hypothetical protein
MGRGVWGGVVALGSVNLDIQIKVDAMPQPG